MSDDDETKPKRVKKTPKHESTVVLLDVGSNMTATVPGTDRCALDLAKEVLEWILTRKIFAKSADEFTLILFGSEETRNNFANGAENVYFCEEEMQTAKIDWLKFIANEITPNEHLDGDFMTALIVGVDYMRTCLEVAQETEITARNILLLSNLGGSYDDDDMNIDSVDANAIVNGMKALDVNFSAIGPTVHCWTDGEDSNEGNKEGEEGSPSSEPPTKTDIEMGLGERILSDIAKKVDGVVYSFREALPMLQHFVPRRVNIRGQKFLLELGEDIKLPLQLFKKNQEPDMKMNFAKIDQTTGAEVKRQTIYERPIGDDSSQSATPNANASGPKILRKEDVIKGYTFGATIVPFNEEDQKEYGWKRESRCMKLLQFAKRSEILEHYLMDGGVYYCLPPANDQEGATAVSALVRAMLEEDCVALVRYVYNAASLPRIMALFPRISNKGVDMLMGILLPFYEDFRGLEFPPIVDDLHKPKAEQMRAIEAFVDAMDLSKSYFDPETGSYDEDLRPRNVPNPKLQRICEAMKHRALHPGEELPQFESQILKQLLEPRPQLLKMASEPLAWIKKTFPLQEVPSRKRKVNNNDDPLLSDSFPSFGEDESSLPAGGRLIAVNEVKVEDMEEDIVKKESSPSTA
uniref:Ku domain-containing protein n=1 Tax=Ascaris lumbricoides TaxID=6252 RepID=A0A0M3I3G5_ASCLU